MADDKRDSRPFISGDSPSLARAQKEHANPSPTADPQLIASLSRLVELERAQADCAARVKNSEQKTIHARAAATLESLVASLGGRAPLADEVRDGLLPSSASDFEYLQDSGQIRDALANNNTAIASSYADLLAGAIPDDVRAVVERLRR